MTAAQGRTAVGDLAERVDADAAVCCLAQAAWQTLVAQIRGLHGCARALPMSEPRCPFHHGPPRIGNPSLSWTIGIRCLCLYPMASDGFKTRFRSR